MIVARDGWIFYRYIDGELKTTLKVPVGTLIKEEYKVCDTNEVHIGQSHFK